MYCSTQWFCYKYQWFCYKHHHPESLSPSSKKKKRVQNWRMVGPLCKQTVNLKTDSETHYYSIQASPVCRTFFESLQQRVINSQMKKAKLIRVRQQGCIRELCTTCSKFCLLGKSHTGMGSDMVLSRNFQCNVAWQFVRIMLLAMQHLRKNYM